MSEKHTDTPLLTERFDNALLYASAHHRLQLRKGGQVPYLAHLLAVASIALEAGATEDEAIGALLHDVIEDGGGMDAHAEITERFGPDVARIVLANSDSVTGEAEKAPWRERKQDYIDAIAHKPHDALLVSLADKVHNARSILHDHKTVGEDLWARFETGEGESVRWYYRSLTEAFEARSDELGEAAQPALRELREIVDELDARAASEASA